jgi:tetratricopeptide (TPR) repeat protein
MDSRLPKYIIVIVLCISAIFAQSSIISAANNLTNSAKTDSTSENSQRKELIESIANASDSLQKITAYYNYGTFLDEQEEFEKAVIQLRNALRVANSISNYEVVTKTTNYLGGMYWSAGDCETSTSYFEQALENAKLIENNDLIAMVKMNLSGNYNSSGDANKAVEYALAALEIREKNNNLEGICFDYVTVGEIFQNIGNIDKWKLYIKKAYDLKDNEDCAKMTDLVMIYNNMGTIAEAEKEYIQALAYYDTMMIVSKSNNYYDGVGISRLNSALIYQLLEKPEKALELTTESIQYLGDVPYFIMAVNNVKAELLQELGKYTEALELVAQTLKNEELEYYPGLKQQCLSLLYSLNFKLKNYQQAFNWNDTLTNYENKLREEENLKAVEELETKYQTEKKEQQIQLLTTENRLKNQRLKAGIAIVAILIILIFLILYILRIRKKQSQLKQTDLQQQVLRSQMNPHFIFNVLGSIQNYMMQNDTRKASNFLSQFAALTRATLNNSTAETISLADEIGMLRNYIELEKMRSQNKFDFAIEYHDDLEIDFIQIPPMLIQPFVENSIKHGFKNLNESGFLKLQISDKTDWIEFVIEDNGEGIQKNREKQKDHKSMAMVIFEKRRKLIQQKYNKYFNYKMLNIKDTSPDKTGVKIIIDIPTIE